MDIDGRDRMLFSMGASVEDRVRALLARGEHEAAVTLALEAFGGEVLGYLCAFQDEDDARDAYSLFQEDVLHGLETWRGEGSLRAWLYRVAGNAAKRISRDTYRRRRERLPSSAASRLAASAPTGSGDVRGGRRDRLRQLRAELPPEDQALLVLHVDRGLDWEEVAAVLGVPSATLRKRFERLKAKLASMARRKGLVSG